MEPLNALIIAAHPDDAEIGMAGTILSMKRDGLRVGVLDLSWGEPTNFGDEETRRRECQQSTELLGLDWRHNVALPTRYLEPTLEARTVVATCIRLVQPQRIFAPFWIDPHPDHTATTKLAEDARCWSQLVKIDLPFHVAGPYQILYYEGLYMRHNVPPTFIMNISDFWEKKEEVLRCYDSQLVRNQFVPYPIDAIKAHAAFWGRKAFCQYGETFYSREYLGVRSIVNVM